MKHLAKILIVTMLLSLVCAAVPAMAADDFEGVWEYDTYDIWYEFDDGDWAAYYRDGMILDGYYEISGGILEAYLPDGTLQQTMEPDGEYMLDSEEDMLFASSLPEMETSELEEAGATGVWEVLTDDPCWIVIYPGGMFASYDEEEELMIGFARLEGDDTVLLLENDDDDAADAVITLTIGEDGDLTDEYNETFVAGYLPFRHDSILAVPSFDSIFTPASDYVGVWDYDEYPLTFDIRTDDTWASYTTDGQIEGGYWDVISTDGVKVVLYLPDGTEDYILTPNGDGTMTDDSGDRLTAVNALPDFEESELAELEADGIWETDETEHIWLEIYPGNTWFAYDEDGYMASGTIALGDHNTILLQHTADEDESESLALSFNANGELVSDDGEVFFRSALPY